MRAGVDIGGTKVLAVLLADDDSVIDEVRLATPRGTGLVSTVVSALAQLSSAPTSVGIGAPGLVTATGVLLAAPNIVGVDNLDLAGAFAEVLSIAAVIDNDNTCATVAEWRIGAGRGWDDLVYVGLGTGIGGGMVTSGALRRGAHGFAGELGHMIVDPAGPPCPCGKRGCWERYGSGSGLAWLAERAGLAASSPSDVLAAARADGADARAVRAEFVRYVALGLANLTNVLDPQGFVLGGGVMDDGDDLVELIGHELGGALYGTELGRPTPAVRRARFGSRSAAIGAALLGGQ